MRFGNTKEVGDGFIEDPGEGDDLIGIKAPYFVTLQRALHL
jgi:hypothetical protein